METDQRCDRIKGSSRDNNLKNPHDPSLGEAVTISLAGLVLR
ncbi:MAG: hypothetical protein QOH71_2566 [Blastocatellia bacterium]|jgi:hypothetical protein|nr:hypothetical protein [Blastocatellia bacterium]